MFSYIRHSFLHLHNIISPFGQFVKFCVYISILTPHTHSLRHTSPTLLYEENDVNIFVLKKILGHESLEATQIYTHVSNKKLKELMMNFNILDREEQT